MSSSSGGATHANVFERLGVRPVINAKGPYTKWGGALMVEEALRAFEEAAGYWVNVLLLQRKAGAYLAERLGVEAAYVSSGASGGIYVSVAACLAGTDGEKIERLPEIKDGPDELIPLRAPRAFYNPGARAAGARLREVGTTDGATVKDLNRAVSDRTAAVLYYSMYAVQGKLPLSAVVEVVRNHPASGDRRIPILVDSAAELPPRENMTRPIEEGADLVIISGGKELRGPQGTGLVLGKKDLIEGCLANGCPHDAIGRSLKVSKEEIVALVAAVERYLDFDLEAQWRSWEDQIALVVEELKGCPRVRAERYMLSPTSECRPVMPNALIRWDEDALGKTMDDVETELLAGDPSVVLRREPHGLAFSPQVLLPGQARLVVERLKEVLGGDPAREL